MKKIRETGKRIKFKYLAMFFVVVLVGVCGYMGDRSEAAEGLTLTCDGYELNSATAYQMKNKQITLILGSESDPIYADKSKYEVRWSIETGMDIADINEGSEQIYGIVTAKAPGEVTVLVTIYNRVGDEIGDTIGSITCKIQVVFGIDTSRNDNVFKYPYEDSTDKAIFLHTDSQPEPLVLNYGDSKNAQWTSANDEVVSVSPEGVVTARGAGNTKITATYTPPDSPDTTYTTTIDVYVYPSVNFEDSDYKKNTEFGLDTGGLIYTDTNFTNNYEAMQRKMAWVIKKDDGNGGEYVIADSLGKTSDLISINSVSSRSNQLQVDAKAGKYYVYFYPKSAYESDSRFISDEVFAPTVLTLSIFANFNDYKETIPIGSTYDIAEAFNLTTEEFMEYFDVTMSCNVGDASNYASLSNGVVTAQNKNEGSTTVVTAHVVVKEAYKHIISQLVNPNRSDSSQMQSRTAFDVELTIADVFKLDQSYMTMYAGAEITLNAYFNSKSIAGTNIVWGTSNDQFATVDATGKVVARKVTSEDVVITAIYETDTGARFYAECRIRIVATADNLLISQTELSMNVGDSAVLDVTCSPDVSYPGYDWYISDPDCLTMSLTADKKTATISAKAVPKDGKTIAVIVTNPANKKSQVCHVTINAPYEELQVTEQEVTMKTGTTHQLRYTFKPNNVTQKDLEWQSLDTSIVTVDEYGTLTGKAPGTTYVMVSPKYNPNGVYAQCAVTVLAACEKLELSEKQVTFNVKDEKVIKVNLSPKGCTTTLDWNVSDSSIASVKYDPETHQATLVGKKVGKTIVFVRSDDGPSAQIDVTVLQPCLGLSFSPNTYEMLAGETYTPNLVKTPADTTDKITWTTYNSAVAKVDANGVITGVKTGSTFIQATSASGKVAMLMVNVKEGLTNVVLKQEEAAIKVNETITLEPEFTPLAAYDKSMTWTVSDPTVAQIENDGVSNVKVTGLKVGVALVTGRSKIGNFEVHCLVTVNGLSNVTLEQTEATIVVQETITLSPTFTPEEAFDKSMTWTVADPSIVKIEPDGESDVKVTGLKVGVTLVTGTSTDGNFQVNCLVTVAGLSDVTLEPEEMTIVVNQSEKLAPQFFPEEAYDKSMTWTVSDPDVVQIDPDEENQSNIIVTGLKVGSALVKGVSTDGGHVVSCLVTVAGLEGVTLSPDNASIIVNETMTLTPEFNPVTAVDKAMTWTVSDSTVVKIEPDGESNVKVTGLKVGMSLVTGQSRDGGYLVSCLVTVRGLAGVTLQPDNATIEVDQSMMLTPQFDPETAFDKSMTWTVADGTVAKIEPDGVSNVKVTGLKGGVTLVQGVATDGGYMVSCLVTVTEKSTAVTVSPTSKLLQKGKSFTITATVTSNTATDKTVKWSSSKKSIATVSSKGVVRGKKIGTTYITATAKDRSGASARCKVRVIRRITSIKLNKYTAKLLVGNTMVLKAKIYPKNATIKGLSWSSSDNSIATVDSTGRIHGIAAGVVKIRAKAQDGSGKSAVCLLTVMDPVPATGVDVANNDIIVVKGRQIQSGIQVAPANSTDKIKFYSDNPRVAKINKRGKIYARKVGQATVYGETPDGKRGAADVLVVRLNRTKLKFRVYDTETLRVDEIKEGVTWHSKNPLIASVDENGKVTGRRKGVTRVYAKVRGLRISCKVTVTGL